MRPVELQHRIHTPMSVGLPVELQHRIRVGVVGALEVEVVQLGLVVLELVPTPARPSLSLADQGLVRAADGGLGVVGGLPRRPDEAAVGRRRALDLHRSGTALLALRVDQAGVDGEHPPVLPALATHRAGLPWLLCGDCVRLDGLPVRFICPGAAVRGRFLAGHGFVGVGNLAAKSESLTIFVSRWPTSRLQLGRAAVADIGPRKNY